MSFSQYCTLLFLYQKKYLEKFFFQFDWNVSFFVLWEQDYRRHGTVSCYETIFIITFSITHVFFQKVFSILCITQAPREWLRNRECQYTDKWSWDRGRFWGRKSYRRRPWSWQRLMEAVYAALYMVKANFRLPAWWSSWLILLNFLCRTNSLISALP